MGSLKKSAQQIEVIGRGGWAAEVWWFHDFIVGTGGWCAFIVVTIRGELWCHTAAIIIAIVDFWH